MRSALDRLKGNAYVCSNGCQESRIDTTKVERFLQLNGWKIVDELSQADLIVFYVCGLTTTAEKESFTILKEFKAKMKPEAQLVA